MSRVSVSCFIFAFFLEQALILKDLFLPTLLVLLTHSPTYVGEIVWFSRQNVLLLSMSLVSRFTFFLRFLEPR